MVNRPTYESASPSKWELRPDDLLPARIIADEPLPPGLEDNAIFRLLWFRHRCGARLGGTRNLVLSFVSAYAVLGVLGVAGLSPVFGICAALVTGFVMWAFLGRFNDKFLLTIPKTFGVDLLLAGVTPEELMSAVWGYFLVAEITGRGKAWLPVLGAVALSACFFAPGGYWVVGIPVVLLTAYSCPRLLAQRQIALAQAHRRVSHEMFGREKRAVLKQGVAVAGGGCVVASFVVISLMFFTMAFEALYETLVSETHFSLPAAMRLTAVLTATCLGLTWGCATAVSADAFMLTNAAQLESDLAHILEQERLRAFGE